MKNLFRIILFVSFATAVFAQSKSLFNLDKNSLAIQGYDPVAFFTDNKPVKGDPKLSTSFKGANYLFASKEHKDLFDKEPSKYEPAFGGYCAFGVSRNKLVEIDPDAFQIVDGRLLLQYSKSVRNNFNKDTQGNLAKANGNWPSLVEKNGK
jgi:YHS domain-containing protein